MYPNDVVEEVCMQHIACFVTFLVKKREDWLEACFGHILDKVLMFVFSSIRCVVV